jgi:ABC-type enterochelin transport system permease subunit
MITLIGIATIILGIFYFLACDNLGKTLITPNEILVTRLLVGAGICAASAGLVLEVFK